MAALVLTTAAQSLAGAAGMGATATAALQAGAALAGNLIDQSMFGQPNQQRQSNGPQLTDLSVSASTEGKPIPRIYGRMRVAGQLIWATDFEEQISRQTSTTGGKGGGGGGGVTTTSTTYSYYANVAFALCEGEIAHVSRIWADGKPLDVTDLTWRVHLGSSDQFPDPLIEARLGFGTVPAYRDTAYVVFEQLPIGPFGNRLPQFAFEVWRPIASLENKIGAVCIIPGATEFGYDPLAFDRVGSSAAVGSLGAEPENRHLASATSDWSASMDLMDAVLPACAEATLVTAWFGDDLRAAATTVRPRVENPDKSTTPESWHVAGLSRAQAGAVSGPLGEPAYGGTPNDASVVRAIKDLKARGKAVTLMPFILMDVPSDNALSRPDGGVGQPAHPWRGRVRVDDISDETADAAAQIASFMGAASTDEFSLSGTTVIYGGADEWRYRRFILHHAMLAVAAGGVDTFLIGSEMVGLTRARDENGAYPFVEALRQLAADCRTILGPDTQISYAADWSEYHSHRPDDGSGDVFFNMDSLWSDSNIDFIGIDNYFPLSDWRDEWDCLDRQDFAVARPTDGAYLQSNIEGGEYFDWYYASGGARAGTNRIPISDPDHQMPWVYRQKDIRSWWLNQHRDRTGQSLSVQVSPWLPQSKPIRFTELGCAAVDKASNTPNRFRDAKSSEDGLPWFSRGNRDDAQQRSHLEAVLDYWSAEGGRNPISIVYDGPMIDVDRAAVWCWDARPLPAFPRDKRLWADSGNWDAGHWISGRMGTAPLSTLLPALLQDHGLDARQTSGLDHGLDGFAITSGGDGRRIIEPLIQLFDVGLRESDNAIDLIGSAGRDADIVIDLDLDGIRDRSGEVVAITRPPENDKPSSVQIGFVDPDIDDQSAMVRAVVPFEANGNAGAIGGTGPVERHGIQGAMTLAIAEHLAQARLRSSILATRTLTVTLPPSWLALEVADVVRLVGKDAPNGLYRVSRLQEADGWQVTLEAFDGEVFAAMPRERRSQSWQAPAVRGSVRFELLDVPRLEGGADGAAVFVAAFSEPWTPVAVYRSQSTGLRRLVATIRRPATMGVTRNDLLTGALWRTDNAVSLEVELFGGTLTGVSQSDLLGGFNLAGLRDGQSENWEVIQFRDAELIGTNRYRLSGLLRGQGGSLREEGSLEAGASFMLLDDALVSIEAADDLLEREFSWRFGPYDKDATDALYQTHQASLTGIAMRPLPPVHLSADRHIDDSLTINWIRQTRIGGDRWDVEDVALGEAAERYAIDVLGPDDTVLRSAVIEQPSWTYSSADQIADFGTMQSQIKFSVRQWSERFGYGRAARSTLDV
jgi:hypothetical protein